jgi:transcriptional regulator with XRE-family HTH domain
MKKYEQIRKQISSRFMEFRLKHGLTQAELSKQLRTNQSTISRIENMERLPSTELLVKLMEKFDLSVKWLLSGSKEMSEISTGNNDVTPYKEEFDDLLFHLENVPLVREYILTNFLVFRFKNKEKISKYLEKQNRIRMNAR